MTLRYFVLLRAVAIVAELASSAMHERFAPALPRHAASGAATLRRRGDRVEPSRVASSARLELNVSQSSAEMLS